jgi:hypothetical protein
MGKMKATVQAKLLAILGELPEEANWHDFKRAIQTFERIHQGVIDLENGRVWTTEKLRNHFRKKTFS